MGGSADWVYCPACAEPVALVERDDPGCFFGFVMGVVIAATVLLVTSGLMSL